MLAIKTDPKVSAAPHHAAVSCLLDFGLSERYAEKFLDQAYEKYDRRMIRSADQTLNDVQTFFRTPEHSFILTQIQTVLETRDITREGQAFFDKCCEYLYHER